MGFKRFWLSLIIVLSLAVPAYSADIRTGGGHQIIDQGLTTMPQQPKLNFTGPAVSCANNAGTTSTDCTFSQTGAPPANLYVKGHTYPAELNWMEDGACPLSTCLSFDGSNDYISVANHADLNPTVAMTIEAWVKVTNASDYRMVVTKDDGSTNRQYDLWVDNSTCYPGAVFFQNSSTSTTALGAQTICDGDWHHLAATVNTAGDGKARLYIDGVLAITATDVITSIASTTTTAYIGWRQATYYAYGAIDDVRIWSSQRSVTDIANNMNIELAGTEVNLAAYWKLNEASGTAAEDDEDGTDQDGVLNNFAAPPTSVSGWQHSGWNTTASTCKFSTTCVAFDGSNDYIKIFGKDILPTGSTARTIEAWIYPTSTTQRLVIFNYGDPSDNNQFSFEMNGWEAALNGKLIIRTRNNAFRSTNSITASTWTHVAVTFDGTNTTLGTAAKLYINGTEETAVAITGFASTGTINTTVATRDSVATIGRDNDRCMPNMPNCLRFDGVDDYVVITGAADIQPASALTISAWVWWDGYGNDSAIYTTSTDSNVMWIVTTGQVNYRNNSTTTQSTHAVPIKKWTLVTVTHSGSTVKIYFDGVLVKVGTVTYAAPTGDMWIGDRSASTQNFKGQIQDVRLYNAVLSRTDIWNIFNYGHGQACTGDLTNVKLCVKLNETSGTTATDTTGSVNTVANNGTLTNFASVTQNFDTDGWQNNGNFIGKMDEVRVWNTARSQSEISTNKDSEAVGNESGLKLLYQFNGATSTSTVIAVQSATVSGIGSDSNNCTSTSTPCKTITGALSKITSKFFSASSTIHIASGVYPEQVDIVGYHPTGDYTITLLGYINSTMNSFTDSAMFSGTSSGSNTIAFPKDARSLFNDTTKTFDKRISETFLRVTGGAGYITASGYDKANWYPIENYWDKDTLSMVNKLTTDTTTTYEIYNSDDMAIIHGGAKPPLLSLGITTWTLYPSGRDYGVYIQDASGIRVQKLGINNVRAGGIEAETSIINEISTIKSLNNGYIGLHIDLGSFVSNIRNLIASNSFEGAKWEHGSQIANITYNMVARTDNCGFCNYFQSPAGSINYNLFKGVDYSCFDGEHGFFTYFYGYNRHDTCGQGGAIEVAGNSSINSIYPSTVVNSEVGYLVTHGSYLSVNFQDGTVMADMEILYNDVGMKVYENSYLISDYQGAATFTGNTVNVRAEGLALDVSQNAMISGTAPYSNMVRLFVREGANYYGAAGPLTYLKQGVGSHLVYSATFDPASLSANSTREETITVSGVAATDHIISIKKPSYTAGYVVGGSIRTAANTVYVTVSNPTGSASDPGSEAWLFLVGTTETANSTADCALVARDFSDGEDLIGILVKDGGCP